MRVISLLPAATEIVAALGMNEALVGTSHECDFPAEITDRPRVTHCEIHHSGRSSEEVDRWVRETLAARGTLYTLDERTMRALEPDVILTQRLCDVCAIGYGSVAAFAATLRKPPRIVNLEPTALHDIFANIRLVADVLDVAERATPLIAALEQRVQHVARAAPVSAHLRCFLMEWIEPPFCAGHWNPELVRLAGGSDPLGRSGERSREVSWDEIQRADPDLIVLACCGFDVTTTQREMRVLESNPAWRALRAVREGRVHVLDGNSYFSRPGPRIVDSLEMLAEIVTNTVHDSRVGSD